jgi:hypothetical protein
LASEPLFEELDPTGVACQPYSADRLSPSTSTTGRVSAGAFLAGCCAFEALGVAATTAKTTPANVPMMRPIKARRTEFQQAIIL